MNFWDTMPVTMLYRDPSPLICCLFSKLMSKSTHVKVYDSASSAMIEDFGFNYAEK